MSLPLPLRLCLLGIMAPALSEASQTQSLDVPHSSPSKGNLPVSQKHLNGLESDSFITIWKNEFEAKNFMNCGELCNGVDKFPVSDLPKNGNLYLDLINQELNFSAGNTQNQTNDLDTLAWASELKKSEDKKEPESSSLNIMSEGPEFGLDINDKSMGLRKANTSLGNAGDKTRDSRVMNGNSPKLISDKFHLSDFDTPGLVNDFENNLLNIIGGNGDLSSQNQNHQYEQGSNSTFVSESLEPHDFLPDIDVISMINDNLDDNLGVDQREAVIKERKEELEKRHHEIERRCERILRRLHKVQCRGLSDHVSRQLCKYVEYAHKTLKVPCIATLQEQENDSRVKGVQEVLQTDSARQLSTAALINLVKEMQMNPGKVPKTNFKSLSDSVEKDVNGVSSELSESVKNSIQSTCGNLLQQLKRTAKVTDPDLTASSSGGESCDELETSSKMRTLEMPLKPIPLQQRALWRWAAERASIASRWAWLKTQIADLDNKIKLYSDLYRELRKGKACKPPITKEDTFSFPFSDKTLTGKSSRTCITELRDNLTESFIDSSPLSEQSTTLENEYEPSRVKPVKPIRKRKLIYTSAACDKAARLGKFSCGCLPPISSCVLCGGKKRSVVEMDSDLSFNDKVGLMDPNFHPVLSFTSDIPLHLYLNAKLHNLPRNFGFHTKSRSAFRRVDTSDRKYNNKTQDYFKENGRHIYRKLKRNSGASEHDEDKKSSRGNSPNFYENKVEKKDRFSNPEIPRRKRQDSAYDIDNIVIPYSIASSARVEKLPYKEILTPGWREIPCLAKCTNIDQSSQEEIEDTSDEAYALRHHKLELDERQRFGTAALGHVNSGRGRPRRIDSRADSSGTNTPDPMSPYPQDSNIDNYSPLGTPPSTPRTDSEPPILSQLSKGERRTRTMSNHRRCQHQDDSRCSTPLLDCDDFVLPYSPRDFPLNDEDASKLEDTCLLNSHVNLDSTASKFDLSQDQNLASSSDTLKKVVINGYDAGCSNPG